MKSNAIRRQTGYTLQQISCVVHIALLCVMLVLKVLRAYSGAQTTGGAWNIIQLFFIFSGMVTTLQYARVHHWQPAVAVFIVFGFVTTGIALTKPMEFTTSQLFNLVTIPYGPMVLVWVYYLSLSGEMTKLHRYVYGVFYLMAAITMVAMVRFRMGLADKGAVADVYYIVALLPFAMFHVRRRSRGVLVRRIVRKRKPVRYSLNWRIFLPVAAAAAVTVMTGKRAGILAIAAMLLVYFLVALHQQQSGKRRLRLIALFMAALMVTLLAVQMLDERYGLNVAERLLALAEDGGSNRDVIWSKRLDAILTATPRQLLLGYDSNPFAGHAHNDFLELMVLYGIFPLLLYLGYYVLLMMALRRMRKTGYPYAPEFSAAIISGLFLSMFSFFVIDPTYITSHAFSTGVMLADYRAYTKAGGQRP